MYSDPSLRVGPSRRGSSDRGVGASGSSEGGVRAPGSSDGGVRVPERSRSPVRQTVRAPRSSDGGVRVPERSRSPVRRRQTPAPPPAPPPPHLRRSPPQPPRASGGQGVEGLGWCRSCRKWRTECFQRNDWECERCDNHNYANKRTCTRCGLRRSAFQIRPDGLDTDGKKVDKRRVCASHQCPIIECFKPFDWMCSCGNHNYAGKTVLSGI